MQVFPRETTDYISQQFFLYFDRQRSKRTGLSLKDARTLVDFVGEPTPVKPAGVSGFDYSKPSVQGGGRTRPSEAEACGIIEREQDRDQWDEVFRELMRVCGQEPDVERFIKCLWQDEMSEQELCEQLHFEPRTYYRWRVVILSKAGVYAVAKGLMEA